MPAPARTTLARTVCPAAAVLALAALAERGGAETATFYLFLAGVPVAGVGALAALGRLVDARGGRWEAALAAGLVASFCIGAAARSPVLLPVGGPAGPATLALAFAVLALLAVAVVHPSRR